MTPKIATLIFVVGMGLLFRLDPIRNCRTSKALWIAVLWFSIAGSRSVSSWLAAFGGGGSVTDVNSNPDYYLEGNPIDRPILIGLLVVGAVVLAVRWQKVWGVLLANGPILCFFLYCAISCLWSDYPDVAFKRWIKFLGDFVVVLLILTDANPLAAVKRLLAWTGFVLIPVSVLLIKYYPDLGRGYHLWDWTPYYTGVTTNKNELGYVCLIFGVASVWRILSALRERKAVREVLLAHGAVLAMVFWLFSMAGSMTSFSCFLMGTCILVATSLRMVRRRPWVVHCLVAAMLLFSASTLFLDVGTGVLETMGRNPTLTGRTEIWSLVLKLTKNRIVGTGFESFWLGDRLRKMWDIYWWHPNQSHNGYIEIFINLGWVGILLLGVVLVTSYGRVLTAFRRNTGTGTLRLAYFVIGITYNFTEAAFKAMHPVWIVFMLATLMVPGGWEPRQRKKKKLEQGVVNLPEELRLESA